jgi:hypothetical protein
VTPAEASGKDTSASLKDLPIGNHFIGERLVYEMTFMMLFNAARLVIELLPDKKKGRYIASFQAETKGFIGWITGYRKYYFHTVLQEIDGGKRFLPHRFETLKIIKKKKYKQIYQFDYEKKELRMQKFKKDHLDFKKNHPEKSLTIPFFPKRNYIDILTLFYNFRHGSLGPIEKEREYRILGLPINNQDKKEIIYTIELFSKEKEAEKRDDLGWKKPGYVAKVQIDREILTTREGIIWVLLDRNMVPLEGILKDAIGFGDVVGELSRHNG